MEAVLSTPTCQIETRRGMAAAGVVGISLLAAGALALFSTEQAVGGEWVDRAIIPLRMLLLVAAATFALRFTGLTWRDVGLRRPGSLWRTAGLVVAGYFGIGLMFVLITQVAFPMLGITPETLGLFAAVEGNLAEYLYWLLPIAWGSAAFGEELLFRGYMQSRLQEAFGGNGAAMIAALFLQAVIFGALHSYQGLGGAILAGSTGLILGTVYLAGRGNLWAPIVLHGLVDTVTLTAVFTGAASQLG